MATYMMGMQTGRTYKWNLVAASGKTTARAGIVMAILMALSASPEFVLSYKVLGYLHQNQRKG
jgi:hypothetical protein